MHRFFVPPEWIDEERAAIGGSLVHQIRNVLRLDKGEVICILDNSGWEYEVELEKISRNQVTGTIRSKAISPGEPGIRLIIYQGMLKGTKFELVLQKGTELGVAGFVPVLCKHSVAAADNSSGAKFGRWQRIIREAAEQSHRGRLPFLSHPQTFLDACRKADVFSLIAWERERTMGLRAALREVLVRTKAQVTSPRPKASLRPVQDSPQLNLFVGPEGGFAEHEVEFASSLGIIPVSLGLRPLRAETASIAAAAIILYEWREPD